MPFASYLPYTFLHAEIMKMSVSGAKTVPKSGKSYEDLCFAMFA